MGKSEIGNRIGWMGVEAPKQVEEDSRIEGRPSGHGWESHD